MCGALTEVPVLQTRQRQLQAAVVGRQRHHLRLQLPAALLRRRQLALQPTHLLLHITCSRDIHIKLSSIEVLITRVYIGF